VGTGLRVALVVFAEVAVVEGIGAEAGGEFESDAFDSRHQALAFTLREGWPVVQPGAGAGFEEVEPERDVHGLIFAYRIAPTAPGIAQFAGEGHGAEGVEIEQGGRLPGVVEAQVGDFEVTMADAVGLLEFTLPFPPADEDFLPRGANRGGQRMGFHIVEGGAQLGHAGWRLVNGALRRPKRVAPTRQGGMEATHQGASLGSVLGVVQAVESMSWQVGEEAPATAVVQEAEFTLTGGQEPWSRDASGGEMACNRIDILMDFWVEHWVDPLQDRPRRYANPPGLVDQSCVGLAAEGPLGIPVGESLLRSLVGYFVHQIRSILQSFGSCCQPRLSIPHTHPRNKVGIHKMRSINRSLLLVLLLWSLVPWPVAEAASGTGWHGEMMPEGLLRGEAEGDYLWQKDGSVMVYVPPGLFTMGSEEGGRDEKPVREVWLDAFYIDKYEVSWRQWKLSELPYSEEPSSRLRQPRAPDWGIIDEQPMLNVSWYDTQAWLGWAGKRLPSEAEWEVAARGKTGRSYPWGETKPDPNRANYDESKIGKTTPVGTYGEGVTPEGLWDMAGNVLEWCLDG